jgi:hypothetical protein
VLDLHAKNYDSQAIADALPGRTRQAVIVRHARVGATIKGRSIHIEAPQTPKNEGPWNEQELASKLYLKGLAGRGNLVVYEYKGLQSGLGHQQNRAKISPGQK